MIDFITVRDGQIFWRGVHRDHAECALILAEFSRTLPAGDWFAPRQQAIAERLREAMAEADAQAAAYHILEGA